MGVKKILLSVCEDVGRMGGCDARRWRWIGGKGRKEA